MKHDTCPRCGIELQIDRTAWRLVYRARCTFCGTSLRWDSSPRWILALLLCAGWTLLIAATVPDLRGVSQLEAAKHVLFIGFAVVCCFAIVRAIPIMPVVCADE